MFNSKPWIFSNKAPLDGELSGKFGSVTVPAASGTEWDNAQVWRILVKWSYLQCFVQDVSWLGSECFWMDLWPKLPVHGWNIFQIFYGLQTRWSRRVQAFFINHPRRTTAKLVALTLKSILKVLNFFGLSVPHYTGWEEKSKSIKIDKWCDRQVNYLFVLLYNFLNN